MDKTFESKMDKEHNFDKQSKREGENSDADDGSRDQKSYSKSSLSNKSSIKSQIQVKESGINMPRYFHKNKEMRDKDNERDANRKILGGRVEKHRRYTTKRRGRRAPRRRPRTRAERRRREVSMSTIITTLSSGSRTPACVHCGHRCCQRRYEYFCRRREKRDERNMEEEVYKDGRGKDTRSKVNQVGSRCAMLSPLFIKTNSSPMEQDPQDIPHCEISPEMIYQALRRLTMRRQGVKSDAILEYIKNNYPVDSDVNNLSAELEEKLRVAAIIGIVTRLTPDHWCLPTALQQRSLTKSHVTQFWQAYIDTMRPVTKKEETPDNKEPERNKTFYDKIKESCYL
ncbi:uncharacterized protein [Epargyreus clarus]|uniref:uncharacterized protein isoform X2 n=1 Tax=Epargyreus clarus TaxID=520877 RepID=UPI003C2F5341